jgi:hypothetical protein
MTTRILADLSVFRPGARGPTPTGGRGDRARGYACEPTCRTRQTDVSTFTAALAGGRRMRASHRHIPDTLIVELNVARSRSLG